MAMIKQSITGGNLAQPDWMDARPYNPPWATPTLAPAINKNPVPTNLGSVIENEMYRSKLVAMRLRLREGENMPFQYFATALAGDKVFVFVVQDGQAVVLEDDAPLFPSDKLITQLRLLEK